MSNLVEIKTQIVTLELGGKMRALRYDMNAFALLEQKYGSVDAAMEALKTGSMGNIKYVLWAGLVHEEVKSFDQETGEPTGYNITPYQVGSWIAPTQLGSVMLQLTAAITGAQPSSDAITDALVQQGTDPAVAVQQVAALVPPVTPLILVEEDTGKNVKTM